CFHGVSRWYKDCGCNTGGKEGWDQKWRTPVREGYTALSSRLVSIFKNEVAKLSNIEPSEILDEYIAVLTESETQENFFIRVVKEGCRTTKNKTTLFRLLEGQKFRMYTFTSCGWFFSELSGIEPVQNLKYAMRAIEIYSDFTDEDLSEILLHYLEKAHSNIKNKGTGKNIYQSLVSRQKGEIEAAVNFLLERMSDSDNKEQPADYGNFSLLEFSDTVSDKLRKSRLRITERTTTREFIFEITSNDISLKDISIRNISDNSKPTKQSRVVLMDLSEDLRKKTADIFLSNTEKMYNIYSRKRFIELSNTWEYIQMLNIPISKTIRNTSELVANSQLKNILSNPDKYLSETDLDTIENLLQFVGNFKIEIEKSDIASRLSGYLSAHFAKYYSTTDTISVEYIYRLYKIAQIGGIEPEITISQNLIFEHIKKWSKKIENHDFKNDAETQRLLEQLLTMSRILLINSDTLNEIITKHGIFLKL
ncbi:MAG: DUF3536 domain-containing protein, partial [Spirochaetales bacterium]|nr:DUF3536 domain-containing protein [Spirochaetales bacterium]